MKKKTLNARLSLQKKTITSLTAQEGSQVVGGMSHPLGSRCPTCDPTCQEPAPSNSCPWQCGATGLLITCQPGCNQTVPGTEAC